MSELAGQNAVPKPQNDIGVSASNPISSDNGEMKPSDLLSSHNHPQNKNLSKSSFSHYSPLSTRSRKITSPSSSFPFSPVSGSESDMSHTSDLVSPNTPGAFRKRTISSTSHDDNRFVPFSPPALSSMSRSSSTLSLCSNISQATSITPIEKLLKHLRDRLSGYLFSGWYTERRYVDAIDRYRDVIVVDGVESVIIKQIKYAIKKCAKILEKDSFIGLTQGDDEIKLFVNLGSTVPGIEVTHPFGHYWFQIKSINFLSNLGLYFEIVVVRQFVSSDSAESSCWKCKSRQSQPDTPVKIDSISAALMDMKNRVAEASSEMMLELWQPGQVWSNIRPHLSITNVTQMTKLCAVLVLAAVTGLIAGIKQLGLFSLKLLHELANLVDRSTPLALAALNMMGKIVGGAYLLIAMIWRDAVKKPAGQPAGGQQQPPRQLQLGLNRTPVVNSDQFTQRRVRPVPDQPGFSEAMDHAYSQTRPW